MPPFVLDASVAISWCFPGDPTEDTPYSRRVLGLLSASDAVVPEIWAFEVANSIFVSYSRRRRITDDQIREYLVLLKALPIHVQGETLWVNVDLEVVSHRRNISAYDAAYLELSRRGSLPLATADDVLKRAGIGEGIALVG